MKIYELRLMISELNPSVGFLMLPTLEYSDGWILMALLDQQNVQIEYNAERFTISCRDQSYKMTDASMVAHRVIDMLVMPSTLG